MAQADETSKMRNNFMLLVAPWVLTAFTGWLAYEFRDFKSEVRGLKEAIVQLQVSNSSYATKIEAHEGRISRIETKLDGHIQEDLSLRIKGR
jgi:hypothetical protein